MLRALCVLLCVPLMVAGCPNASSLTPDGSGQVTTGNPSDGNPTTTNTETKPAVESPFDGDWSLTGEDLASPLCVSIRYGQVVRNDAGCDGTEEDVYANTVIAGDDQTAEIRWQYSLPGGGLFCHERLTLARVANGRYAGACTNVRVVRESGRVVSVDSVDEIVFVRQN